MREIAVDIIQKAAAGDMDAFEEIYKAYSSTVYTIALGITRDPEDAEEAAQDVFVKVFRNLKNFKFGSAFGTWIYRITVNTAINIYHARARRGRTVTSGIEALGDIADPAPAGQRIAAGQKDAQAVMARILENLSAEHRSCIMLREIEGLDYKEMAGVLGISINTVRSRLKRAREAMLAYGRKGGVNYEL